MQNVQETNLAWSLIDVAKPELDARERQHVFVSVGAGESFTAIRILIKLIAIKQIPLHPSLVQLCATWLEAYALHEDHDRIRMLIDGFTAPVPERRSWVISRSVAATSQSAALTISAGLCQRNVYASARAVCT